MQIIVQIGLLGESKLETEQYVKNKSWSFNAPLSPKIQAASFTTGRIEHMKCEVTSWDILGAF